MLARLQFASRPVLLPGAPATRSFSVDADAPAERAMTDFRSAPLITTDCDESIEEALQQMKRSGARLAFVVGADRELLGAVSAQDIQGEKPVRYLLSAGSAQAECAWRDVQVQHIMDPVANWRVLEHAHVQQMSVAQVAALLAESGLRYLVIVEDAATAGTQQIRGLFSAARVQALLGNTGWAPAVSRGMTSVMLRAKAANEPSTSRYA
jgi:CBS-domain-containing membrane protein